MNDEQKQLTNGIFSTLPDLIGFLFGDPLTIGIAITSLMSKGFGKLSSMNKDWWDEYVTNLDAFELIDERIKSPEYIQFIRKVIVDVSYETREKKRERLFNLALNYHLKYEDVSFDKKMIFLNILDNLSELELLFIISWYEPDFEFQLDHHDRESIKNKLVGVGLISQNFDKIKQAINKMGEQSKKTLELIKEQIDSIDSNNSSFRNANLRNIDMYDSFFDEPKITYGQTDLGKEFVNFIRKPKGIIKHSKSQN